LPPLLAFGRLIAAPPGIPADRVNQLRKALDEAFRNPELLADCANLRFDCSDPIDGEKIAVGLEKAYNTSSEVVDELRRIYQYGGESK
jgi:tripartite-type tricarboxylate transporter receptor subunit TctC